MFLSIDDVIQRFERQRYICSRQIGTVVYLATELRKPALVEGPAGVGKTELAKVLADSLDFDLIRLQCYEGLDEAKALYEWEYAKQLLYTQILKDRFTESMSGANTMREAADRVGQEDTVFFSDKFIVPRPLMQAIRNETPALLLIDEVDKSDPEFEALIGNVHQQVRLPRRSRRRASRHLTEPAQELFRRQVVDGAEVAPFVPPAIDEDERRPPSSPRRPGREL